MTQTYVPPLPTLAFDDGGPTNIHPLACVYPRAVIDRFAKVWQFASVLDGTVVGPDSVVGANCWVGRDCVLGRNVRLQTFVQAPHGTVFEDDVFIGPGVMMCDDNDPRAGKPYHPRPPVFRRGCSVGAGCVIFAGVEIGEGARVAAGTIVKRSVPPGATFGERRLPPHLIRNLARGASTTEHA